MYQFLKESFMRNLNLTLAATLIATAATAQNAKSLHQAENAQDIITEQPAGTLLKGLYVHNEGYIKQLSTIYSHIEDGTAKDVVLGSDGNVYFKNPVQNLNTNSWMKATRGTGDTLVVTLPQKIYVNNDDDEPYYYYLQRMVLGTGKDGSTTYVIDKKTNTIRFVMRGDSIFKAPEDKEAILGFAYPSGNWEGHGSKVMSLKKVTDTPVTPANAETSAQDYAMTTTLSDNTTDMKVVSVAIEGNDIYIGKLNDNQPEQWTKGRIEGDKAIFNGKVYMGLDETKNVHTYFFPAGKKTTEIETPFGTMTQDSIYFLKELVFDYDAANKTLKSEGGFILNQGSEYASAVASYWKPQLSVWKNTVSAPGDPTIVYFEPFNDNMGYSYVQFYLDKNDANGNQLDSKNLYYNIYLDDELMTFTPGDYSIFEDMTDVPYDYANMWDFYIDDQKHTIYFYTTGFSKLGIQAFYLDGDNKLKSNMVTYNLNPTAIKNASQNENSIAKVAYRDLSGREVSQPAHGLYVKTVTYTDGSVKTTKTLIK